MGAPCCPKCFSRRIGPAYETVESGRKVKTYNPKTKKWGRVPATFGVATPGALKCSNCGEGFTKEAALLAGCRVFVAEKVPKSPAEALNRRREPAGFGNRKGERREAKKDVA